MKVKILHRLQAHVVLDAFSRLSLFCLLLCWVVLVGMTKGVHLDSRFKRSEMRLILFLVTVGVKALLLDHRLTAIAKHNPPRTPLFQCWVVSSDQVNRLDITPTLKRGVAGGSSWRVLSNHQGWCKILDITRPIAIAKLAYCVANAHERRWNGNMFSVYFHLAIFRNVLMC